MTRNIPEPAPQTKASSDKEQEAFALLEALFRRIKLQKSTGSGYVRVNAVQGGAADVKAEFNEVIKPTS